MTVSTSVRKAGPYIGTDTVSTFEFDFKVFSASDVLVVRVVSATRAETTLALTTDYTVSLNANQDTDPGGSITLVAGVLPSGYELTIASSIPYTQQVQISNLGGFFPAVLNLALDKLTILAQQLLEVTGRALTLPITVSGVSAELPTPSPSKVLGWNSAGDGLTNIDGASLATIALGSNRVIDRFSGNGVTTAFTLSKDPLLEENTDVFVGGSYVRKDQYSVSGTTLTFASAPAAGTNNIEVEQQTAQTYPITTISGSSLYFAGDTDTGLTTPGANQIALTAGGVQRLVVDSSGRVGVGRTPSAYQIEAAGGVYSTDTGAGGNPQVLLRAHPSVDVGEIGTLSAHSLYLMTSNTTRMSIDASGNVIMGNTSVAGSRSFVVLNASVSAAANATSYVQTDAGILQMVIGSTASGGTAALYSSSAGVFNIYTTAASALQLGTNNVPARLTIDTSGNVNAAVTLSENSTRAFSRNSSSLCGGAQTYDAANKVFTFPHGLGQIPTGWQVWAVCLNGTANTGGAAYPAGHVIAIVNNQSTSMISVTMDTTNVYLRVAGNIAVADYTTPSSIVALVAGAKWSLNVRVWY